LDEIVRQREQEKHDLDDEIVPSPVKPPNTSGHEERANPTPGAGAGGTRTASGREQEKHDLDDEAASLPVRPSKTRGHGKPANPRVDPTTGMPSAAAVTAFVKASCRRL
jgi:hypothetical protein